MFKCFIKNLTGTRQMTNVQSFEILLVRIFFYWFLKSFPLYCTYIWFYTKSKIVPVFFYIFKKQLLFIDSPFPRYFTSAHVFRHRKIGFTQKLEVSKETPS